MQNIHQTKELYLEYILKKPLYIHRIYEKRGFTSRIYLKSICDSVRRQKKFFINEQKVLTDTSPKEICEPALEKTLLG